MEILASESDPGSNDAAKVVHGEESRRVLATVCRVRQLGNEQSTWLDHE